MPSRPVVCTGSAESNGPTPLARTRAADSARDAPLPESLLLAAPQASDVFSEQVLECRVVQQRVGQQSVQAAVLIFQRFQPPGVRDLAPPVLRFPLIEGRARDPVPSAHLFGPRPGLLLAQYPDDLLFREAAS